MSSLKTGLQLLLIGALCQGGLFSISHAKESGNKRESHERNVDAVAMASQDAAITKLSALLKKYRGARQESVLLAKLAELKQQKASIQFRIAHGSAHNTGKAVDLVRYKKTMGEIIGLFDDLIRRFPNYAEIHVAYLNRGKAYEEIGNKLHAAKDYTYLVTHYPNVEQIYPAYMALAEFAIDEGNHPKAIGYLKNVEKDPENPYYPFALYKMAWSYYNLRAIPNSLSYVEKHLAYYNKKLAQLTPQEAAASPDTSLRETMLSDSTTFYFDGFEQKLPEFNTANAYAYFKKLDQGTAYGKMLVRYVKLLRSHNHNDEIQKWKSLVLENDWQRPESLEVVLVTFEHVLNQRNYASVANVSKDIVALNHKSPKIDGYPKAQRMLLETAEKLQGIIVKNKASQDVIPLSESLATIYESFTQIVPEADPRIPRVHYNLAETLFTIKQYDKATENYRWIVDKRITGGAASGLAQQDIKDAPLKAIAARYEVLKQEKLIPTELKPEMLSKTDDSKSMDPKVEEWVKWVDKEDGRTTNEAYDHFLFEANRTLYSNAHIKSATERLLKFAKRNPNSKAAIGSATLALDTYIVSNDWENTHDLAESLMDVKAWAKTDFAKRLYKVAADSSYKLLENDHRAKEYSRALKKAEKFLEKYKDSERTVDTLALAGSSAMNNKDYPRALQYFSRLIEVAPKSNYVGDALLARGNIQEEQYIFAGAAKDYRNYLFHPSSQKVSSGDRAKLRKKILALAWLSGEAGELKAALGSNQICTESLEEECNLYQAFLALGNTSPSDGAIQNAMEQAKKGPDKSKSIWAAVALDSADRLKFHERMSMVRQVANHWDELESLSAFTLLPKISASIPKAFELNRSQMKDIAPLRANEKYIARRIEVIRDMENTGAKVLKKLPWSRVRALVLNEIATLYLNLSRELAALPKPKDLAEKDFAAYDETIRKLTLPFEEKGQEIRGKAFEIASRFAIEDSAFKSVVVPFFQDNPSQANSLQANGTQSNDMKTVTIDLDLADSLDPSGGWSSIDPNKTQESNPVKYLKIRWYLAIQNRKWAQVAFFLQEAKEKKLLSDQSLRVARAVSLYAAGAKGEALTEISELRADLEGSAKKSATIALLSHYYASYSRERSKDLMKELETIDPNGGSRLLSSVRKWNKDK